MVSVYGEAVETTLDRSSVFVAWISSPRLPGDLAKMIFRNHSFYPIVQMYKTSPYIKAKLLALKCISDWSPWAKSVFESYLTILEVRPLPVRLVVVSQRADFHNCQFSQYLAGLHSHNDQIESMLIVTMHWRVDNYTLHHFCWPMGPSVSVDHTLALCASFVSKCSQSFISCVAVVTLWQGISVGQAAEQIDLTSSFSFPTTRCLSHLVWWPLRRAHDAICMSLWGGEKKGAVFD